VQIPVLTVLIYVAGIAFFTRGCMEASRLLDWWHNRSTVQHYRALILRYESRGRLESEHYKRMIQFVERAERSRPDTSSVLSLMGCAIGTFVAALAAGRSMGYFLIAAILRWRGLEPGTINRASDGSGSWFYTRGTLGQVKIHLVKDVEDLDTIHEETGV
jgi:hypothetical protein